LLGSGRLRPPRGEMTQVWLLGERPRGNADRKTHRGQLAHFSCYCGVAKISYVQPFIHGMAASEAVPSSTPPGEMLYRYEVIAGCGSKPLSDIPVAPLLRFLSRSIGCWDEGRMGQRPFRISPGKCQGKHTLPGVLLWSAMQRRGGYAEGLGVVSEPPSSFR
jgi:hypothetical protein